MEIRKLFRAEIAHRLVNSYSVGCQSIHGHSYVFELVLEGRELDNTHMILDFGAVKDTEFKTLIDSWDHSMIICSADPMKDKLVDLLKEFKCRHHVVEFNPTAEMMAEYLYWFAKDKCNLPVKAVLVHETTTGYAKYEGDSLHVPALKLPNGEWA